MTPDSINATFLCLFMIAATSANSRRLLTPRISFGSLEVGCRLSNRRGSWMAELGYSCGETKILGLILIGCDRAGAKDFGGNRTIFCPRGPSVPMTTARQA